MRLVSNSVSGSVGDNNQNLDGLPSLFRACNFLGVIAVSWYPPEQADDQGKPWDNFMPTLLDVANRFAVKVRYFLQKVNVNN